MCLVVLAREQAVSRAVVARNAAMGKSSACRSGDVIGSEKSSTFPIAAHGRTAARPAASRHRGGTRRPDDPTPFPAPAPASARARFSRMSRAGLGATSACMRSAWRESGGHREGAASASAPPAGEGRLPSPLRQGSKLETMVSFPRGPLCHQRRALGARHRFR